MKEEMTSRQEDRIQAVSSIVSADPAGYASTEDYNRRIYDAARSVPQSAVKPIPAGRLRGMSSINGMWRLKMLTELFGPCGEGWMYEITREQTIPVGTETIIMIGIELKYRLKDGSWSVPIPGVGTAGLVVKESKGLFVDSDAPKKALTDAFSVACKSLGIGADVYFEADADKNLPPVQSAGGLPQPPAGGADMTSQIVHYAHLGGVTLDRILKKYEVDSLDKLTPQQSKEALATCRHYAQKAGGR